MKRRWWHDSVVYQVYPKSFLDTTGDGIGDINGITKQLGYLQNLGIDTIWISPFFKSPMVDNGYDISDYNAIDPQFGTMDDFDRLLEEAKEHGIKILIDLVVNHTSDLHPWFVESKSSKTNPKRDWYIWKDGKRYNNWRSCFGGSVWEYDEHTDSSYFHYFHKRQPCLNWENKQVRESIYEMVNWWLDKGIGGFRIDAINVIKKGPLNQNFPVDAEDGLTDAKPGSVGIEGIEIFLNELAEKTFNHYDIMTVAEADVPIEQRSLWTGPKGFFDMAFQFKHAELDVEQDIWHRRRDFNLLEWKENITLEQNSLSDDTWAGVWLENHDHPRSISKYLKEDSPLEAHKMLATTYFFLKGTPFIYQGQEIGMRNIKYESIEQYDDIATHDHYKRALKAGYSEAEAKEIIYRRSRDNTRYPMQWNNSKNYGFSDGSPWLDINQEFPEITVANALADKNSLFYYYKAMVALRKTNEYKDVFSYGSYKLILDKHPTIFAYIREYNGTKVMIISNFSEISSTINLDLKVLTVLLTNTNDKIYSLEQLEIKPYQSCVIEVE